MKYYEIYSMDINGEQGFGRYDNEEFFQEALTNLQNDPFIQFIKWRIIETGEYTK